MAIKRKPNDPLFRIVSENVLIMKFRAKNDKFAKAEANRQTLILRRSNPGSKYGIDRYSDGAWESIGDIEHKSTPEPEAKIAEGGVVVVAPAGDSPLRELYESPEFRAAWANREEK